MLISDQLCSFTFAFLKHSHSYEDGYILEYNLNPARRSEMTGLTCSFLQGILCQVPIFGGSVFLLSYSVGP